MYGYGTIAIGAGNSFLFDSMDVMMYLYAFVTCVHLSLKCFS